MPDLAIVDRYVHRPCLNGLRLFKGVMGVDVPRRQDPPSCRLCGPTANTYPDLDRLFRAGIDHREHDAAVVQRSGTGQRWQATALDRLTRTQRGDVERGPQRLASVVRGVHLENVVIGSDHELVARGQEERMQAMASLSAWRLKISSVKAATSASRTVDVWPKR